MVTCNKLGGVLCSKTLLSVSVDSIPGTNDLLYLEQLEPMAPARLPMIPRVVITYGKERKRAKVKDEEETDVKYSTLEKPCFQTNSYQVFI